MDEINELREALAAAVIFLTTHGACNHRPHWYPAAYTYLDRVGSDVYLEDLIDRGVESLSRANAN